MLLSKVDKQIGERMQHIKYIYGVEELRERCRAALKRLDTDTEYSMEDIIEYYNIGHFIEEKDKINNSIFNYEEEKLKEYEKKIKQVAGKFMNSIDDSNCKEIYDQLEIGRAERGLRPANQQTYPCRWSGRWPFSWSRS